ncbi:nitric oxide synthase, inducible-like isoform X2 [Apostichopus japonicus]|uniref:nitric oxide synthase, inducible-like isoform X2 n=1 Tax=Stichopus japonicus TaxID=307972 RepID=UPI003AB87234
MAQQDECGDGAPRSSFFRSTWSASFAPSSRRKLQRTRSMDTPQHLTVLLPRGDGQVPGEASKSPKKEWKESGDEINLKNDQNGVEFIDTLHQKSVSPVIHSKNNSSLSTVATESKLVGVIPSKDQLIREAVEFIDQFYAHLQRAGTIGHQTRLAEVRTNIEDKNTYTLTESELIFGARLAWRNSPSSVMRINWSNLKVFDARKVTTAREMFEALCRHLLYALNGGSIKCAVTIFPQAIEQSKQFRIWNQRLIGYAGYKEPDGHVIGDLHSVEITEICTSLGWHGDGGRYDVLPLIIQAAGGETELFELPKELVMEVNLCHAEYDSFEDLDLKCYVIPSVANQGLEIGGLVFPACPMNEIYTDSQICSLSYLRDPPLIKEMASRFNIDAEGDVLWTERTYMELNVAVLHSFKKQCVSIIDHHTALDEFDQFFEDEHLLRGGCPTDVKAVRSMTSAYGREFDQHTLCYLLKPAFFEQIDPWKTAQPQQKARRVQTPRKSEVRPLPCLKEDTLLVKEEKIVPQKIENELAKPKIPASKQTKLTKPPPPRDPPKPMKSQTRPSTASGYSKQTPQPLPLPMPKSTSQMASKSVKATILFATQTGNAQRFAAKTFDLLSRAINTRMIRMDEYDVTDLSDEDLLIVITSTAHNSQPPPNGERFCSELFELARNNDIRVPDSICCERFSSMSRNVFKEKSISREGMLQDTSFAVFGLGSSVYPHLCPFAWAVDNILDRLGGNRLAECGEGDAVGNLQCDFEKWLSTTLQTIAKKYELVNKIGSPVSFTKNQIAAAGQDWGSSHFRIYTESKGKEGAELCEGLSKLHGNDVRPFLLIARKNLLAPDSGRSCFLLRMSCQKDQELLYQPGDVISLFPANNSSQVDRILRRLDYHKSPDAVFKLEKLVQKDTRLGRLKVWTSITRLPVCSVRMALCRYLDITTPPSPDLLRLLAIRAGEPKERERLLVLGMGGDIYDEWKLEEAPTIADILERFESLRVPASLLITQLPLLSPRLYSISSSQDLYPSEIHITVTLSTFYTKGNLGEIQHNGVCSSWLQDISTDEIIPACIVSNPSFHIPKDDSVPMMLVATGTGIAPFRSFWQHRETDLTKYDSAPEVPESDRRVPNFGDMTLVYGCRKATVDEPYRSELITAKEHGAITSTMMTFSREESQQRRYVQDVLRDHPWLVYSTICRRNGHVFVSGDVTMATEVRITVEAILSQYGRMSMVDAQNYVTRMKEDCRYHENIFGLVLHVADVIKQKRQDKKQPRVLVSRDIIKPIPLGIAGKKASISELAKKFDSDPRRPPSLHQRRATATVLMPRYSKPLMIPQVERNDDVNNNMKGHSGSK